MAGNGIKPSRRHHSLLTAVRYVRGSLLSVARYPTHDTKVVIFL